MPKGKSVPLAVRGAIVALHKCAGMDWKEICTQVGVLPETARTIYKRAKVPVQIRTLKSKTEQE